MFRFKNSQVRVTVRQSQGRLGEKAVDLGKGGHTTMGEDLPDGHTVFAARRSGRRGGLNGFPTETRTFGSEEEKARHVDKALAHLEEATRDQKPSLVGPFVVPEGKVAINVQVPVPPGTPVDEGQGMYLVDKSEHTDAVFQAVHSTFDP